MKKKIIALCLCVAMLAIAIVGGTLAYFTDTDDAVNVMTMGSVKIEQIEEERNANGDLVPFTQAKPALPAVGPIAWANDVLAVGGGNQKVFTPELKNVIDKFIYVENTGKSNAYIRTIIAIEAPAYDADNLIHVNVNATNGVTMTAWTPVEIDGIEYVYSVFTYADALAPKAKTPVSLAQVFLDSATTNEDVVAYGDTWEILAISQAVQADGFADAATALDAAFDPVDEAKVIEWFGGMNVPVMVSSAEDMYAALAAGETDVIVKGATITENNFNGRYYKDRNVDFVDCTFSANMNYMYINDATYTNCTFDCGSDFAAVHYDELFGDLVFNNCTFKSGKIQIGANSGVTGTVTFNDCVFAETAGTSIWSEKGVRVYSPAEFNNCEFNNRVVMAGANDLPITFNNCTMENGTPVYYVDNTDGIIRGGNIPTVTIN